VIIDTGAKGFGADGVYILTRGDAAFIRNVRRTMDGGHVLEAANPMYRSDKPEQLKGIKVVAKVLMSVGETFA
jgi:phage repressor protein C with HTH and peptisase S24 domain